MKFIRFEINNYEDRNHMVVALANAGYQVWVTTDKDGIFGWKYYVNVKKP